MSIKTGASPAAKLPNSRRKNRCDCGTFAQYDLKSSICKLQPKFPSDHRSASPGGQEKRWRENAHASVQITQRERELRPKFRTGPARRLIRHMTAFTGQVDGQPEGEGRAEQCPPANACEKSASSGPQNRPGSQLNGSG